MPLNNEQIRASLGSAADQIMAIVADHEQGGDECFEFRSQVLDFFADALGFQVAGSASVELRQIDPDDIELVELTPEQTADAVEDKLFAAIMDMVASTDIILHKGIPPKNLKKKSMKLARETEKSWKAILGNRKKPGWDDYRRMWIHTLKNCLERSEK